MPLVWNEQSIVDELAATIAYMVKFQTTDTIIDRISQADDRTWDEDLNDDKIYVN